MPRGFIGSNWWKIDFHAHSPASNDAFKNSDTVSDRDWLLAQMAAELDAVVITDHNTGSRVVSLKNSLAALQKEKPAGFRELVLFPGVEISANGPMHILAIFDPAKGGGDIDHLLGAVGYNGTKGDSDTVTTESAFNVVRKIIEHGGIAVPAHVDQEKGLGSLLGETKKQVLDAEGLLALEIVDGNTSFNTASTKQTFVRVVGSDCHKLNEIGRRYTWVKMTRPNLEGLSLALLDGERSVICNDKVPHDLNDQHGQIYIEKLKIGDAKYMGNGEPLEIEFSPWLNAIIGSRGTGKSSLLGFMRLALRRQDELGKPEQDEIRREFDSFAQIPAGKNGRGLLKAGTWVELDYIKDGVRFRVQWDQLASRAAILQQESSGEYKAVQGNVLSRFPARILNQKQIFAMATKPQALLSVVDEAVNRNSWQQRWKIEEGQYLTLRAKARELDIALKDEGRLKGELDDLKRRLLVFEGMGHAEVLREYQLRIRQEQAVNQWLESLEIVEKKLRDALEQVVLDAPEIELFDRTKTADASLLDVVETLLQGQNTFKSELERLLAQTCRANKKARDLLFESAWARAVGKAKEDFLLLEKRLKDAGAGDPTEYGKLVQQLKVVEQQIGRFDGLRNSGLELTVQAEKSLEKLAKIRSNELTLPRAEFLKESVQGNQHVSMGIVPYGNREPVIAELRELLGKATAYQPDFEALEEKLYGDGVIDWDDVAQVLAFENRLKELKAQIRAWHAGDTSYQPKDKRFLSYLAELRPETLDRLDVWFPEDSLQVEYNPGGGEDFKPLDQGSPGQKTAAVLAFLMAYGTEPLILDQPEDDLDNALIYGLITQQLRAIKPIRQVIVVTHNPNIVVHGDAEYVLALDFLNGQTWKNTNGGLQEQEVRDKICQVMEGGREAFEKRYRRLEGGRHV
jgi:hypothetical protein